MRIGHKLTLGFLAVASLIWAVGYLSINASQKELQDTIGNSSVASAAKILQQIEGAVHNTITFFQREANSRSARNFLAKSNQEFEKIPDIQAYINERNRRLTATPKEQASSVMRQFLDEEFITELEEVLNFYKDRFGFHVISKVVFTNKYGASIIQESITADYGHAEQYWWQYAKKHGLYLGDIKYDPDTNTYHVDIAIRIADKKEQFLGIAKTRFNIQETIDIVQQAEAHTQYNTTEFKLLTEDGKIIYATEKTSPLKEISPKLFSAIQAQQHGYFINDGDMPDEDQETFAYARSKEHKDFKSPDWILIQEHETAEILAPVVKLRNRLMTISALITFIAVLLGLYISKSISRPVEKLKTAIAKIGKGQLGTPIDIESNDEIGRLAKAFRKMTDDLKKTTTSMDSLKREIRERKKAEAEIETLARFPSENPNPVLRISRDHVILYANNASEPILDKWHLSVGEKLHNRYQQRIDNAFELNQICVFEFACDNGRIFSITLSPVVEEGYVNVYGSDITRRKQAERSMEQLNSDLALTVEKLTQANRQLRDFAHVAAHDLKSPLRTIGTLADWIANDYHDKLDSEGQRKIEMLVQRSHRVTRLLDAILNYSQIEYSAEPEEDVDINKLVSEIIADLDPPENIKITIQKNLPHLACVKEHMAKVLWNLLKNAITHMDKPQGKIAVSCDQEQNFWRFNIADNGPGIEEKFFDKIFGVFQTLRPAENSQNTGIGLSTVKKIVETYGGTISVKSIHGHGSTFSFTFPRYQVEIAKHEKFQAGAANRG